MNIKYLLTIIFATFLFSNSAFSQTIDPTYVNCADNRNGIAQSNNKSSGAPGHTIDTRRGNNGNGNGGESWDIYVDVLNSGLLDITVVCIKTADENTYGTQYLKLPLWPDYQAIGSTRELDPGKLGSFQP